MIMSTHTIVTKGFMTAQHRMVSIMHIPMIVPGIRIAMMDKMIKVDQDINVNEVAIYDVVIEFCGIPIPFVA